MSVIYPDLIELQKVPLTCSLWFPSTKLLVLKDVMMSQSKFFICVSVKV